MKFITRRKITALTIVIAAFASSVAWCAEARPWLCRDKPVFSSNLPMEFSATARPGRQWKMFFMQFQADSGHDGFDIVNSRDLNARGEAVTGRLEAGRYFAVALYRGASGVWVCPSYTHEDRNTKLGELSSLCYGQDGPPCLVTLKVTPDHSIASPPPAPGP